MHMSGPEYDNWLTQRGAMQGATSPTMTMFDAYGHTYDLDNLTDKTEAITKLWVLGVLVDSVQL